MHISVGAAILILGLLFLATSKAGLKVLGVVAVVVVVGVGAAYVYSNHQTAAQRASQGVRTLRDGSFQARPARSRPATYALVCGHCPAHPLVVKTRRTAGPPMSAQATAKEHFPKRTGARRSAYIDGLSLDRVQHASENPLHEERLALRRLEQGHALGGAGAVPSARAQEGVRDVQPAS